MQVCSQLRIETDDEAVVVFEHMAEHSMGVTRGTFEITIRRGDDVRSAALSLWALHALREFFWAVDRDDEMVDAG